jgi:predicted  nucleic acid-binding Zn-ribbon protein
MSQLSLLIELQSVHDNLRVIQRDLTAFPPDLASLDSELKNLARKIEETNKALGTAKAQHGTLSASLAAAQKLEDNSKAALKDTKQKVQFTAAIRELDERQRQKAAVARPLKEIDARIDALVKALDEMEARQSAAQAQFQELRSVFLSEHQNQVDAEAILLKKKEELQKGMDPQELVKFDRLIQGRQGRAVVTLDKNTCGGCRTKLRTPLLAQLREEKIVVCESCQRILHDPASTKP